MTDKKLTDSEIIKALEECIELRFDDTEYATVKLDTLTNALDLIIRRQAENERLKSCIKTEKEVREIAKRTMEPLVKEITREQIDIAVKLAKVEAYKECIEKVRKLAVGMHPCSDELRVFDNDLDNLLKELMGENND